MPSTENQPAQSTTYRIVTFAFGALFLGLSIAVFVVSNRSLGAAIAGVVIGGLGLDAMISAVRSKQSLLARIGPLP
ncbi:MAG: hypothetical protein ABIP56_04650 [Dokdonella sp.]